MKWTILRWCLQNQSENWAIQQVEPYPYQIRPYSGLPKAETVWVPSNIYSPVQPYLYGYGLKPYTPCYTLQGGNHWVRWSVRWSQHYLPAKWSIPNIAWVLSLKFWYYTCICTTGCATMVGVLCDCSVAGLSKPLTLSVAEISYWKCVHTSVL